MGYNNKINLLSVNLIRVKVLIKHFKRLLLVFQNSLLSE